MKNFNATFRYAMEHRRIQIWASLIIFFGLFIWILIAQGVDGKFQDGKHWWQGLNWFADWLDPLIGVGVLLVAISVWLGELNQDWQESLEKRLTVRFHFDGKEIMRCEEAYLASEGDIRSWGQQIGAQMTGGEGKLKFEPFIVEDQTPLILYDEGLKKNYKLYFSTVFLTEHPKVIGLADPVMNSYNHTIQLKDEYDVLIWRRKSSKYFLDEIEGSTED